MPEMWVNRLTVIGPQHRVNRFQKSDWNSRLKATHSDLLENSPDRIAWQFDSTEPLLDRVGQLSRRWPKLVFLLEHEEEAQRIKGLAKAQAGQLSCCQFDY
jgi:hypothetical protein